MASGTDGGGHDEGARAGGAAGYPAGWEADVVLHDGSTAHLRPIRPDDADALQAFHVAQSEHSTYLRFFAAMERLSPRDLERLTTVDHTDRVALVAVGAADGVERILGVARFDRITPDEAEVAFNVADAHQGRGLGSVLLEHLAAAAHERGVRRFVAEVLPQNGRMISVFREAGYEVAAHTDDGVVTVTFEIDPTDRSLAVMADREQRSEARSVHQLLSARRVVVVGSTRNRPGSTRDLLTRRVTANLAACDGVELHLVDVPAEASDAVGASDGAGGAVVRRWERLADVPDAELAVLAVPAEDAAATIPLLAARGVRGIVLLSTGFAEQGAEGLERQRALVRGAHAAGMRVVGPGSYGLISRRPGATPLDASLAEALPVPGRIGLFCQSSAMAVALLGSVVRRGLGLSSFVSAGNRADVSGNDVMQYWGHDEHTDVVGLYLESIGNPRKFSRVARRLATVTPVVVVTAGRSGQVVPPGHAVRPTYAPRRTLEQVLRRAGVVAVDNTHQLLDVVQLFAHQPLPTGRRVAIVASSTSMAALVAEAAAAGGLLVGSRVVVLPEDADRAAVRAHVEQVYADPEVDVVIAVRIPTVGGPDTVVPQEVARVAAGSGKATVACMLGLHGVTDELTAGGATVPAYTTPEDAVLALGHAARYAAWRGSERGAPVHPAGSRTRAARQLVAGWLADGRRTLDPSECAELLATIGVQVLRSVPVHDADEAVRAADELGWPVALKSTAPALRNRADLGGVRLDVRDADELRADVAQVLEVAERAGAPRAPRSAAGGRAPLEVQAMAPHGSACVVRSSEDPLFGPVVSFGLAGDASELLGDVTYGVPPLTDVDIADLVRSARAAPRLFGYRGLPALDVAALEDVVARVAVLADAIPELRSVELEPIVVATRGVTVLAARIELAPADRADTARRVLPA